MPSQQALEQINLRLSRGFTLQIMPITQTPMYKNNSELNNYIVGKNDCYNSKKILILIINRFEMDENNKIQNN